MTASSKLGSLWLDRIENSGVFSSHTLGRGADYARFDWQLEVEIEPGLASTIARAGRRLEYRATLRVPTVPESKWNRIIASIAASTERTAAVLDGDMPTELGDDLLPEADTIVLSCTCRSNDAPCKHAAALLYITAEAIDEDPFELVHLVGLSKTDLIERVTSARHSEPREAAVTPIAAVAHDRLQWPTELGPLPEDRPLPTRPGELPPFPTDPPANAAFTADGLRTLASDAAERAHRLLRDHQTGWAQLTATADLARRASVARGTDRWRHLVRQSGVSNRELEARANAWELGGAPAVEAHVAPVEVRRMNDRSTGDAVQLRRVVDDWYVFEKRRGRWEVAAGPCPTVDLTRYDEIE